MTVGTKPKPAEKSTAVAVNPRDALKLELARYLPSLATLVPKGYDPRAIVTGALVAATREPKLLECDRTSVALAVAQIALWGLDIGYTAHLVPFYDSRKKKLLCAPIADYKGYIEIMCASGARKVEGHEVREGDEFKWSLGTDPFIQHIPKSSTAKIIGAYAIVWLRGGVTQFEVMSLVEIEAIRASSKQWASGELPAWYARKTPIRRLFKYVPKTPRLQRLIDSDEQLLTEGAEPSSELLAMLEPKPTRQGYHPVSSDGLERLLDGGGQVEGKREQEESPAKDGAKAAAAATDATPAPASSPATEPGDADESAAGFGGEELPFK